jgi:Xaa-Pro dipeptidase
MSDDASRIGQLQAGLRAQGVDAAVLRLPENVLLATGYYAQVGGTALAVVPADGPVTFIVPDYEAEEAGGCFDGDIRTFPVIRLDGPPAGEAIQRHLEAVAGELGVRGGAIGFEGSFESVAPATLAGEPNAVAGPTQALLRASFGVESLVDVTETLEGVRAVKTEDDLRRLEIVNEVAMIGLAAFKEHARPGITEAGLAAEIEAAVLRDGHGYRGARVVRAWATVWSGPETAIGWQYFRSRPRAIDRDDVVMVEMGTVADGYWADHTRTVVAGRATAQQRAAFDAARGATGVAFAAARPGVTGGAVDAAAREHCSGAGFTQFPHHTGHGVGFRYHETRPQLVPGGEDVLQEGMVVAAEPGIYEDGLGGFRWEDNAVVAPGGARVLATSDYGLDADD